MYPFERFSENAKKTLTYAQEEAERAHHSYIGTEHLLIGLMREREGLASTALSALGQEVEDLRRAIDAVLTASSDVSPIQQIIPTSRVKRVIEMAFEEARDEGLSQVGTGQMLIALLKEGEGIGAKVLLDRGISVEQVRDQLKALQAAGKTESSAPSSTATPVSRWEIPVTEADGKVVNIRIVFPSDYAQQRQQAFVTRIRQAIEGGLAAQPD